jgi:hypothetical protein
MVERGERVGEEPNHTMAKMSDPLYIIQYYLEMRFKGTIQPDYSRSAWKWYLSIDLGLVISIFNFAYFSFEFFIAVQSSKPLNKVLL